MLISRKTKYAIKALQYLALVSDHQPVLISEISESQSIPHKFLELILLELKKHGFVQSRKGKGGGYLLSKAPEDITLADIINGLEGGFAPIQCVDPKQSNACEECGGGELCSLKASMSEVYAGMAQVLGSTTLAAMNRREQDLRMQKRNLIYYEI